MKNALLVFGLLTLLFLPVAVREAGNVMNETAVLSNGGQMPVLWEGCPKMDSDPVHKCADKAHAKHWYLADILVSDSGISSVGDELLDVCDHLYPANLVGVILAGMYFTFRRPS